MRVGLIAWQLAAVLLLAGCAPTKADLFTARSAGKGVVVERPVGAEQAYAIALQILRWEAGVSVEEHKAQGILLATVVYRSRSVESYEGDSTDLVGVFLEPIDQQRTKVTCVVRTRPREQGPITEAGFHERFQQALAIVKAGKPLPSSAPAEERPPVEVAPGDCKTDRDCKEGVCVEHACRK